MEREERERREKGLRLFGVRILGEEDEVAAMDEEEVIRKSASMGNLASCAAGLMAVEQGAGDHGYLSDGGLVQSRRRQRRQERKKGVPWTEEEHRTFLAGLAKLGKGDWRGISRNFVTTRTPTQVASHAQKYFLRQKNPNKKKRRSSLFDVVIGDNAAAPEMDPTLSLQKRHEVTNEIKYLHLDSDKAEGSALLKAQVPSRGGEDASALPPVTNHGGTAIFPSANIMMGISGSSMKGQAVPASSLASPITVPDQVATMVQCTTACAPDFLQLSLPCTNPQAHTSAAAAPPVESSDLELSIAPPQPHGLVNLSPQATAGAISVV